MLENSRMIVLAHRPAGNGGSPGGGQPPPWNLRTKYPPVRPTNNIVVAAKNNHKPNLEFSIGGPFPSPPHLRLPFPLLPPPVGGPLCRSVITVSLFPTTPWVVTSLTNLHHPYRPHRFRIRLRQEGSEEANPVPPQERCTRRARDRRWE